MAVSPKNIHPGILGSSAKHRDQLNPRTLKAHSTFSSPEEHVLVVIGSGNAGQAFVRPATVKDQNEGHPLWITRSQPMLNRPVPIVDIIMFDIIARSVDGEEYDLSGEKLYLGVGGNIATEPQTGAAPVPIGHIFKGNVAMLYPLGCAMSYLSGQFRQTTETTSKDEKPPVRRSRERKTG